MKVAFFGTPGFAVPSLEILSANGYEIPVVVTAPSRPSGRGLRVVDSEVHSAAVRLGIPILQPAKLNDPEFLEQMKKIDASVFVVVAFRMMPESLWRMPSLGTFNLHASLLPQYRGAAPINRALMNGETETGVTTFFLKHEIDTGNIILREKIKIHPDETAGELHDRLAAAGAKLVLETMNLIRSGNVPEVSQEQMKNESESLMSAPKIFANDCLIHWGQPANDIHNLVRGLSPYPGAFTFFAGPNGDSQKIKIFRTMLSGEHTNEKPGTIKVTYNRILISCGDQFLEVLELQQEGRKRLPAKEFLKGFRHQGHMAAEPPENN